LTQKRTVPVSIQGREYRIRADGDQADVQRAAELVDETMAKVKARGGSADTFDVAVLAALNLANAIATGRASPGTAPGLGRRIADLAKLVETATADSGPTAS
jgi:cell division protein ZapA (FtsZ GTPase activity inhibitor)